MRWKSYTIFFAFLGLALLALWLAPISSAEREFSRLRSEGRWDACDHKHESDRLFVLRLYSRLSPILQNLLALKAYDSQQDVPFTLYRSDWLEFGRSTHWGDLKREALRMEGFLDSQRWRQWQNDFEELLEFDRARLAGRLKEKPATYQFLPRSAVRRLGKYEFRILLDAGELENAQHAIEQVIENGWSLSPYRLHVEWVKSDVRAYRFVLDPSSPYNLVDHEKKTIHLKNRVSDGTLVHEVGHVLGFADHYWVGWSSKKCELSHEAYLWDLMANSSYKRPLPGHWAIIHAAYAIGAAEGIARKIEYTQMDVLQESRVGKTKTP